MMNEQFENMSLTELGDTVKGALACICRKLREDEGFGYDMHCTVTSFGSEDYDIRIGVIDEYNHPTGLDWPRSYWF